MQKRTRQHVRAQHGAGSNDESTIDCGLYGNKVTIKKTVKVASAKRYRNYSAAKHARCETAALDDASESCSIFSGASMGGAEQPRDWDDMVDEECK